MPTKKLDWHLNHHLSKYIAYSITNLFKPFEHFCKLSINLEDRKITKYYNYCPKKMHLTFLLPTNFYVQNINVYTKPRSLRCLPSKLLFAKAKPLS